MDEPHFPKFPPPGAATREEPLRVATAPRVPIVVTRPESAAEGEKAGFSRDEIRALLDTTTVNAPRSKWSRSGRRATSFVALAVLGWLLDALIGFWPSTIVTTALGFALFVWTIRPLWQQRDWA